MGERRWLRGGLLVLAVTPAWIAAWSLAAPHSFYRSFPGAGHRWVAPLGAYDQHLVRDFGAMQLGFLVLLLIAAVRLDRLLVRAALVAYAAASLPHFVYHLTTTERLSTPDNVASLAGLALNALLPLWLLWIARGGDRRSAPPPDEARAPAPAPAMRS